MKPKIGYCMAYDDITSIRFYYLNSIEDLKDRANNEWKYIIKGRMLFQKYNKSIKWMNEKFDENTGHYDILTLMQGNNSSNIGPFEYTDNDKMLLFQGIFK